MFSQLYTHIAYVQIGIDTIWELHTLTIAGDSKTVFLSGGILCLISTYFQHVVVIEGAAFLQLLLEIQKQYSVST